MGGAHLHTPQSIFQHTMSHQSLPSQTNDGHWLKMPQVPPMSMPWSVPSFQQPDLVRFTGERPLQPFGPIIHQKRKLEAPDVISIRPAKQLITEEKMAQHFQDMHISINLDNNADPGPSTSAGVISQNSKLSNDLVFRDALDTRDNTEPRLVISDELKRLQEEPILPSSLLSKLERPTMALVLWEPPSKHLRILSTPRDTPTLTPPSHDNNNNGMNIDNTNNNNSNDNNNSESIPNLNQRMDMNVGEPNFEPMDL